MGLVQMLRQWACYAQLLCLHIKDSGYQFYMHFKNKKLWFLSGFANWRRDEGRFFMNSASNSGNSFHIFVVEFFITLFINLSLSVKVFHYLYLCRMFKLCYSWSYKFTVWWYPVKITFKMENRNSTALELSVVRTASDHFAAAPRET